MNKSGCFQFIVPRSSFIVYLSARAVVGVWGAPGWNG